MTEDVRCVVASSEEGGLMGGDGGENSKISRDKESSRRLCKSGKGCSNEKSPGILDKDDQRFRSHDNTTMALHTAQRIEAPQCIRGHYTGSCCMAERCG